MLFNELEQYFLTIDSTGHVIDGLKIDFSEDLSNSNFTFDKTRNIYKFETAVLSTFSIDTLKMYFTEEYSKIKKFLKIQKISGMNYMKQIYY